MLWESMGVVWDELELDMNERKKENESGNLKEVVLKVCLWQLLVVLYYIILDDIWEKREKERDGKWTEKVVFLYFVCVSV